MKKILSKVLIALSAIMMTGVFTGCHEADPEFVHINFFISKLTMRPCIDTNARLYDFVIKEYDANGVDITEELAKLQDEADKVKLGEGGFGVATVEVPESDKEVMDLTQAYLMAELTYDEIITPGLVGPHDITNPGEDGINRGMLVYVKAGSGKVRPYYIIGNYTKY